MPHAPALWIEAARTPALRETRFDPGPDDLEIATLFSGISRGTERLIFEGAVPEAEHLRMRCPLQEGDFPFPVKYGYAAVGRVVDGPKVRLGEIVFALHPHQARFACPATMALPVPGSVPPERAILAANMETALNIVWDAGAGPGDRIAVVGAGVVGALSGWICGRMPGTEVTLIDINPARRALAATLGCGFALPGEAAAGADVVVHTSASEAGLGTALGLAGTEATVVEASWYGNRPVSAPLGAAFHAQRLQIRSSQVGRLPPARAPRWSHARRLAKALDLLSDPVLDVLINGETAFFDLPRVYGAILGDPETLCHRVRYP